MSDGAGIYQISLDYTNDVHGKSLFASFPFIADGKPVKGISCGISSIYAGDMKYEDENKNRSVLFTGLDLNPVNVYGLKQIHSRTVLTVDSGNPPSIDADGMVTHDQNLTLSVTIADCLPVFLLDVKSGVFGLVHSGWKGTGIAANALILMREKYGTNPVDIAAVLGPCIASCCYRVDEQRALIFEKDFGAESVRKTDNGHFLDLKRANISLLKNAGVKNIAVCSECTFCDERLGSFRREGSSYTHMAALANC
jgi:YfiH family protein